MKIIVKIWVLSGIIGAIFIHQTKCDADYLTQDSHHDQEDKSYQPSVNRYQQATAYVPKSHDDVPSDARHYQSLESRYNTPEVTSYHIQYHGASEPTQYQQPEDPSYHRPQEIAYQRSPIEYQPTVYQYQQPYQGSPHYSQTDGKKEYQSPPQHRQKYEEPESYHSTEEEVDDSKYDGETEDSKYAVEEPKYSQKPASSSSSHPAPVPTDPKLPLYFTMYEKRIVQDPLDKYGKGPWRYLQYGHGITYGSKEPGKVFEKGYGYIRALGRDHCKLPENLCPPTDEKPFDYEGRKEPYFGYRPH